MKILYHIIQVGDGINCLCQNESGEYYKKHIAYAKEDRLTFDSEEVAWQYINKYLDPNLYYPLWSLQNMEFFKGKIITNI
jgi:hypothetical protein